MRKSIGICLAKGVKLDLENDVAELIVGNSGIGKTKALVGHLNSIEGRNYIAFFGTSECLTKDEKSLYNIKNATIIDIKELINKTELKIEEGQSLPLAVAEEVARQVNRCTYSYSNIVFCNFNMLLDLANKSEIPLSMIFGGILGAKYDDRRPKYSIDVYLDKVSLNEWSNYIHILKYFKDSNVTVVHTLNGGVVDSELSKYFKVTTVLKDGKVVAKLSAIPKIKKEVKDLKIKIAEDERGIARILKNTDILIDSDLIIYHYKDTDILDIHSDLKIGYMTVGCYSKKVSIEELELKVLKGNNYKDLDVEAKKKAIRLYIEKEVSASDLAIYKGKIRE